MTQDIANIVHSFFAAIDARDWTRAETLMTNPFHLDYSSFGAGPGADLPPGEILTGWKAMLPGFDNTHHQLGALSIETEGNSATVRANVIATHQIKEADGGDTWTVYGDYVLVLVKDGSWRIASNTFNLHLLTGNSELPALAQARAA
ncbi:nuclear transport factor 2 family protein [Mameliella sediminis]|uniref:nuclear transport factor 2 family protein n=1 Tax=Mameliella sediminis TaxID=2836866 RepID=UPI001C48A252|nr:nuclear transport factor 2 family protein [Mameliella sediminis]MBV7396432.1 nuclear transport factor 2 family protein [Mameliella sediminis]